MKKLLNIISVLVAITFHCSCINEELIQDELVSGIRVYSDWTDTRTAHNSENGVTSVSWVLGDKIGLFTEEQSNLCYIAESTGASSEFTASDEMLNADNGDYVYACYPYERLTGQDGKSFCLPHTQGQWSGAGLSRYDALYAAGTVNNGEVNLKFKHIFSFLKITVPTEMLVRDSESGNYVLRIISNEMLSNIEGTFNVETKEFDANCTTDVLYIIEDDITGKSNVTCTVAILPQTGNADISIYAWADNFSVENLLYTIDVPDSGLEAGKVYKLKIRNMQKDYIDEYGINHGPGIEIDGVVWAPVNCGYHAENFKYGKLYQWGRKYGQGYVSSGDQTYSDSIFPEIIQGSVDLRVGQSEENAGRFYCQTPSIDDWCTTFDASLWNVGTDEVPVKTEYDPCPDGWRVPTFSELTALRANYSFWTTADGQEGRWFSGSASYTSEAPQIFFPASGSRDKEDGNCFNRNFSGTYWASRTGVTLGVWNNTVFVASTSCAYGSSVRCVKDDSELISVETVTLGMTELTLEGGETYTLTASITPSTANHKNAHWYSDNSAIVSVDQNGQLTAKSSGTTTITAMAGMQTAKCRVTVISTVPSESDYVDEYGINHGAGVVINGVVWAPVNCGYHETDYKWGKLYQWGRKFGQGYDGPATIEEGGVCVVTGNHKSNADVFYTGFDWVDVQDDKLWNLGSESDPMKTEYDPCPEGWRVPTHKELNVLSQNRSSWISENGLSGCWFSGASSYTETVPQVFLPAAGQRNNEGNADFRGDYGKYWSSQINGFYADKLSFSSGTTNMSFRNRAYGYSVRCVQDDSELIAVENVTLDKTELSLEEGETYTLTASITPSTANHKSAYWYSDNTSVAVVDQNGKVTAVAPGKAVVTAVAGMTAAVCEFTVNAKPVEETKEVTLWQGAALVDDWIADPTVFVLSDGGEELLQAGAKPGQVLYFYVEVLDTFWNLDIYEGHWSKVYLSLDFSSYDIDANGGKIGLTLTDEILATACSPQYWGGSFLLLGDNIKVTKITLL